LCALCDDICACAALQVTRVSQDAPLPAASKAAAQQLANLLLEQRQRAQQARKQQQQPGDAAAAAADGEGEGDDHQLSGSTGLRTQLLSASSQHKGLTRIYVPAPPLAAATSPADRQPLQLLTMRQQQQMREQARKAAIKRVSGSLVGRACMLLLLPLFVAVTFTDICRPVFVPVLVLCCSCVRRQ
jgi:hypothetical protein